MTSLSFFASAVTERLPFGKDSVADDVELTIDEVADIIGSSRRRWVVQHLSGVDDDVGLEIGPLARSLASEEEDKPVQMVTSRERKSAYVGLYQVHLPTLDEYGVVDFGENNRVRKTDRLDDVVALLEDVADRTADESVATTPASPEDVEETVATDGGLPDSFEELATSDTIECAGCGEDVNSRWIYSGRCPGCRYGPGAGAQREPVTDGSGCFFCASETDYHPTCDRPDCQNQTHGYGPDGEQTRAYCKPCRGAVATDGGELLEEIPDDERDEETGYAFGCDDPDCGRVIGGRDLVALAETIAEHRDETGHSMSYIPSIENNQGETTEVEDALGHIQEIIDHMQAVNWPDVPGIGTQEAAAFTARAEQARQELEGSQ